MKIARVIGREVLDSRGNPTVEADLYFEDGSMGRASVPSGASVGSHEAHELRDEDPKRYNGMGELKACENINHIIAGDIVGLDINDQNTFDHRLIALDGTTDKSHLGANSILAVSMAFAKACANSAKLPLFKFLGGQNATTLPLPLINVINGGKHAPDSTDFQEFMVVPLGADTFKQAMQMGMEIYIKLKQIIVERGLSTAVGDEGGFGIPMAKTEEALELLVQAIEQSGYRPGKDISLAIDAASTGFYKDGIYQLQHDGRRLDSRGMQSLMIDLATKYPLFSIEDPLYEDDWDGFQSLMQSLGSTLQIVGDDLFATDVNRLKMGIEKKCANAILVKLNQIGTVSETIEVINFAKKSGMAVIISHRSGETINTFIADLSVAMGTGQIKTGAPVRGERTAKYNQLIRIEEGLGASATLASLS